MFGKKMLFPNLWTLLLLPVVFLAAQDAATSNAATTEPAQQQPRVAFGAINVLHLFFSLLL
jgi:hypothetical protein